MENMEVIRASDDAKAAERSVRRVCRESKQVQSKITETVMKIAQTVQECADGLLDVSGNDRRYRMICRMLACLEEQKRELDAHLASSFYLDQPFMQGMHLCLAWEGEWMPQIPKMAELALPGKRIEKAILSLQSEKEKLVDCRERCSLFSREILPKFLLEVQRLADAEQNGRGMRAQSVCMLCGELCNHISSIIHR